MSISKSRSFKFLLIIICAAAVFLVLFMLLNSSQKKLIVPTFEQILESGYPVNELGETYGPDVKDLAQPDLLLAQSSDGTKGYVRQSDLDDSSKTLEEAIERTKHPIKSRAVHLYLQDGKTVVGKFVIG